jgi:hypothetical protein
MFCVPLPAIAEEPLYGPDGFDGTYRHTAWPDGWGIIGTPRAASNSPYSVVWGEYRSLMDANRMPLLTAVEQHPITNRVMLNPLMRIEQWASGEPVVEVREESQPRQ